MFWHPRGEIIYSSIEQYLKQLLSDNGYQAVRSPQLYRHDMWKQSGHWDHFQQHMFKVEGDMLLKPMNCPAHIQIFRHSVVSHKDLPIRFSEFGCCHRNEPRGALHGIMRLRQFVQDDGHIFCSHDQIGPEIKAFCGLVEQVYAKFGFSKFKASISLRPDDKAGDYSVWDRAEQELESAVKDAGIEYELCPGEGAFYGPKLEFALEDSMGREWQCGTVQLDFVLASRFGISYAGEAGEEEPVVLHRAILGSIERFIGILLEHHGAKLPFWLRPQQVVILPVARQSEDYADKVAQSLPYRVSVDCDGSLGKRIQKYASREPVIVVVGPKDQDNECANVRGIGEVALKHLRHIIENE